MKSLITEHMSDKIRFKSKISLSYILSVLGIFLLITQVNSFVRKDFFNETSWLIYGILVVWIFIFNLFFPWSFEVTSIYLKIRFSSILFYLKPKVYEISDIDYIKINNLRGKGFLPYLSIKLKNKEILQKYYFLLISRKSIKQMFLILEDLNIEVSIV